MMKENLQYYCSRLFSEVRERFMSKYDPLWEWIKINGTESFKLTFAEIEKITGFPIDHSFLTYRKELHVYGYAAGKISMKEQTVAFAKKKQGE